jgi:hypothetical protein
MSISKHDESLALFRGNPDCKVLLGLIGAAGVGIDLRCAEHVYIKVSAHKARKICMEI